MCKPSLVLYIGRFEDYYYVWVIEAMYMLPSTSGALGLCTQFRYIFGQLVGNVICTDHQNSHANPLLLDGACGHRYPHEILA